MDQWHRQYNGLSLSFIFLTAPPVRLVIWTMRAVYTEPTEPVSCARLVKAVSSFLSMQIKPSEITAVHRMGNHK